MTFEEKLERVAELLETARAIVAELANAESVETEADLDASVGEARTLARELVAALDAEPDE